jgi:hypothetical protein
MRTNYYLLLPSLTLVGLQIIFIAFELSCLIISYMSVLCRSTQIIVLMEAHRLCREQREPRDKQPRPAQDFQAK